IGSGFGGSVSALRLTEKGYRVGVLEAGRRWDAGSLPKTSWHARRFLWAPRLGLRGIQRLTLLDDVLVLSGAGVGGGSLVWANVCYEPHEEAFTDSQWSDITDWKKELSSYYDQARRMLGVEVTPHETNADRVLRDVAAHFGVEETWQPTPVAVHFGQAGVEVADPYFGGVGPTRTGCIECGGCMVGCRHNAKNTLDHNYLYLAEKLGAVVHPEHQVVALMPLPDGGYRIVAERPGAWLKKRRRAFTASQVVISAGTLGTSKLLHEMKATGRLPLLSPSLGRLLRTNSESLVGAMAPTAAVDYSQGVAITSSIHPEPQTHIEVVRYPKGSNAMGLLSTIAVEHGPGPQWKRFVRAVIHRPGEFLSSLSVRRWSERSVILLVMQSVDNSLRMTLWRTRWGSRLGTEPEEGKPAPRHVPLAAEAARAAAESIGGVPGCSVNEAILDIPMTAHLIGGACIGSSPETGVVDAYQRVFGYPGLHIADGSVIAANLGANPSLTIAAMTERAMSFWPNKGEPDPRPPLGSPYRPLEPVLPSRPAVPAGARGELRLD
ncbi:MAG: GMC oxidoreductase, partial [Acidimicrobiia bacterium]